MCLNYMDNVSAALVAGSGELAAMTYAMCDSFFRTQHVQASTYELPERVYNALDVLFPALKPNCSCMSM